MTGFCNIYVTTSGEAEAVAIAEALVGERLVACANVLPEVRSIGRRPAAPPKGKRAVPEGTAPRR